MMPSKVFMICDAYESGLGHGLQNDGLTVDKTPFGDPDHSEAYDIGFRKGLMQHFDTYKKQEQKIMKARQ